MPGTLGLLRLTGTLVWGRRPSGGGRTPGAIKHRFHRIPALDTLLIPENKLLSLLGRPGQAIGILDLLTGTANFAHFAKAVPRS